MFYLESSSFSFFNKKRDKAAEENERGKGVWMEATIEAKSLALLYDQQKSNAQKYLKVAT